MSVRPGWLDGDLRRAVAEAMTGSRAAAEVVVGSEPRVDVTVVDWFHDLI